jgi:cysteinyl-tRNA synthetase
MMRAVRSSASIPRWIWWPRRGADRLEQSYAARFKAAMDEDFGTPEAVAVLFELAAEVNRSKSPEVAGLLKALGPAWAAAGRAAEVSAGRCRRRGCHRSADCRRAGQAAKNWAEADRIRKELLEQGIVLKDSAGTTWEAAAKG